MFEAEKFLIKIQPSMMNWSPRMCGNIVRGILICLVSMMVFDNSYGGLGENDVYKIMVVTGGHEFDPSFFQIFDSLTHIEYDTLSQPAFNRFLTTNTLEGYDALVFYDMWQEINEKEKDAYLQLLDNGVGMLFLHHSLVSYQHWDEFKQIIGGKYIDPEYYDDPDLKGSDYKEDITLNIKIINTMHPVTRGLSDFSIFDEGYQDIEVLPGIEPLLSTSHPDCTPVVAWSHQYKNSNIVYILLGHGPQAYENENYRKLIRNAIIWFSREDG